ncbi:MAG TPA: ELM1/GtrOC1 family putative glycosyltransferase, partial [Rhodanobacteraceae bacterium]
GREAFAEFEHLPRPRTAVLLGGPRRGIAFDDAFLRALTAGITRRLQREGGSVLATASRRTPHDYARGVHEAMAPFPGVFWSGDADGANPYPGLLAWADRIIVTPDSVNMLSEAAAVGVPVHTLAAAPLPDKLARFHAALRDRGSLHDLDAQVEKNSSPPLRETAQVARQLRGKIEPGIAGNAQDFIGV